MLMLLTNIGDGFLAFTSIDWKYYLNMTASSTAFLNAVKLAPKVDICTGVCLFDDQVVGDESTTQIRPWIEPPVTLSYH